MRSRPKDSLLWTLPQQKQIRCSVRKRCSHDYSQRLTPAGRVIREAAIREAAGQAGIVRAQGFAADQHGPNATAQLMNHAPGGCAADPTGIAGARGNASVQRACQFDIHVGAGSMRPGGEVRDQVLTGCFGNPHVHLYAAFTQERRAFALHVRIGISSTHHHARDARVQDRPGAWGCAALVVARLQGHPQGALPRVDMLGAGLGNGHYLGMRLSRTFMKPFGHHLPAHGQQSTDTRIRCGATLAAPGQCHGAQHEIFSLVRKRPTVQQQAVQSALLLRAACPRPTRRDSHGRR